MSELGDSNRLDPDFVAHQADRGRADRIAQQPVHPDQGLADDLERGRARQPPAPYELDLEPPPLHLGRDLRTGAVDDAHLVSVLVQGQRPGGRGPGDCPADLEDDPAHHVPEA